MYALLRRLVLTLQKSVAPDDGYLQRSLTEFIEGTVTVTTPSRALGRLASDEAGRKPLPR